MSLWFNSKNKEYYGEDGSFLKSYIDAKLKKHSEDTPIDHPDGSVTDEKLGERTITLNGEVFTENLTESMQRIADGVSTNKTTSNNLQNAIANEASSRVSADNSLQTQITSEANARIAADNNLQNSINTLINEKADEEHTHTADDISGVVKTINGTAPNSQGNITLSSGGDTIDMTSNGNPSLGLSFFEDGEITSFHINDKLKIAGYHYISFRVPDCEYAPSGLSDGYYFAIMQTISNATERIAGLDYFVKCKQIITVFQEKSEDFGIQTWERDIYQINDEDMVETEWRNPFDELRDELNEKADLDHFHYADELRGVVKSVNGVSPDTSGSVTITPEFEGAISEITDSNLTGSQVLISDENGKVSVSGITAAELGFLSGLSKNLETELNKIDSKELGYVYNPNKELLWIKL